MFGENLDALQQAIAQHVSQNPGIQGQVLIVYWFCDVFLLFLNIEHIIRDISSTFSGCRDVASHLLVGVLTTLLWVLDD